MDYAELLQRFAALAASALASGDPAVRVEVVLGDLRLTAARGAVPAPVPVRVPEIETNILAALAEADVPLTGEKLAEVAGYSPTGHFRTVMADLMRRGLIVNLRPGYTLAGKTEESAR